MTDAERAEYWQGVAERALAKQHEPEAQFVDRLVAPETVYKAVERVLDENSAWIARPNDEVTRQIALAATFAAHRIIGELQALDLSSIAAERDGARAALKPFADLGVGSGPDDEPDNQPYRILRGAIRQARAVLEGRLS